MFRNYIFILLLSLSQISFGQDFKLSGKITNIKLEPLAFVSIQVKGLPAATLSIEDGTYKLQLEKGNYDLIITMVGFKNQVINLTVNKNYVQNIILEPEETKNLSEVFIKGKSKDRSEEIIRNVIRNKENILSSAGPRYS